jgi:hypothetical protein
VIGEYDYDHPVFDRPPSPPSKRPAADPGPSHVWFCGAWTRYGFHEDGLMSGAGGGKGLRARWAASPSRTGRVTTTRPCSAIGAVRHMRLRPAVHAFDYPTYFLLLPMRSLRDRPDPGAARATASAC